MGEKDKEAVREPKRLAKRYDSDRKGTQRDPHGLGRDRPVAAPDGEEDDQHRERYAHGADGRLGTAGGVVREDGEAGRGGERGADHLERRPAHEGEPPLTLRCEVAPVDGLERGAGPPHDHLRPREEGHDARQREHGRCGSLPL